MADTLIAGGFVVDGTGAPGEVRDVGIRDGRFVPVDELSGPRVVDASGLVVSPGFVDIHTHYDAQLSWDPTASPSPLHGVTTVLGGNCGFTLAPAGEEHAAYLMRMMARVEGMPLPALEAGLAWDWSTYEDWFGRLDGKIGVNAGFLIGHSAVRRVVMGEDCYEKATPAQIEAMARIVTEACAVGALGFSTSTAPTHNDGDGNPVPSRAAHPDELVALASAVRDVPGTTLECILAGSLNGFTDEEKDLLARMSAGGNRPMNWNILSVSSMNPGGHVPQLEASDYAAERGGRIVALTLPHTMKVRLSFLSGFVFDGLPGWRPILALPLDERKKALADPDVRRRLADGANSEEAGVLRFLADWGKLVMVETHAPENRKYEGKSVADVVEERGGDPFDVLLDIVLADELRTGLTPGVAAENAEDWKLRAEVWRDPRTAVGGSDAGAHLDMMCGAIYSTALLSHGVREFGVVSMEEAVQQLSDVPARLYGLTDRGRIADGNAADVVLFDPDTVGYESERIRDDLPGGSWRLYAEATGVHQVLVNGETVVEDGAFTGEVPGTLLRSGRDTVTVTP
ncbi:MAG TPA: amidohydrolase family protein [Acidimicrobiales bacterium]|jgi:N-acyl-D-aspartate/D-glutamate deacylase|nr:amidohydrolase family protein [Acidimicrobiales bacterium]